MRILLLTGLALLAAGSTPRAQCIQQKLVPGDPQAGANFGRLAVDGDVAVIGAWRHPAGVGTDAGKAYVFERTGTIWAETAQLLPSGAAKHHHFGRYVALDGDRIAVSATGPAAPFGSPGEVYLFERTGSGWVETQVLAPSDGTNNDHFGISVAMQGDVIAVGSSWSPAWDYVGAVYMFEDGPGGFTETAVLTADDPQHERYFGAQVTLSGDTLLVSEPGTVYSSKGGRVYAFERAGTSWSLTQVIGSPEPGPLLFPLDYFGNALAHEDDWFLVSQPASPVYVFFYARETDGTWSESFRVDYGHFGTAFLQLGMEGEHALTTFGGRRYERLADQWVERDPLMSGAAGFPSFVGFSEGQVLGGIPGDDSVLSNAGAVYVFDTSTLEGAPSSVSLSSGGTQTLTLNGCSNLAGEPYLVLGSASGTWPGTPSGSKELPLVFDGYFLFTLSVPNSAILPGSLGFLDGAGEATAAFSLPPGTDPGLAGAILNHAFVVLDSGDLTTRMASNAVAVELAP